MMTQPAHSAHTSSREYKRAVIIRRYIQLHYHERLTLCGLARDLKLSESTVRRSLRLTWNVTVHRLIDECRIGKVRGLLATEPDLKNDALASSVGWRSRTSLHEAIRRLTGQSLAALRAEVTELIPAEPAEPPDA
jgi:AraC-like DNA-binding protein